MFGLLVPGPFLLAAPARGGSGTGRCISGSADVIVGHQLIRGGAGQAVSSAGDVSVGAVSVGAAAVASLASSP